MVGYHQNPTWWGGLTPQTLGSPAGNGAGTIITRSLARRLGIEDRAVPSMIETRGIGSSTECLWTAGPVTIRWGPRAWSWACVWQKTPHKGAQVRAAVCSHALSRQNAACPAPSRPPPRPKRVRSIAGVELVLSSVQMRVDQEPGGLEAGRIDILVGLDVIQKLERRGLRFTSLAP